MYDSINKFIKLSLLGLCIFNLNGTKIFTDCCNNSYSQWLHMNKKIAKPAGIPAGYAHTFYVGSQLQTTINNGVTLLQELNSLWEQDALIRQYCGYSLYYNYNDYFIVIREQATNRIVAVIRFSFDLTNRSGIIEQIAVHKKHRQHGLGSYLLKMAEQTLTIMACTSVMLCVHNKNEKALSVYKKIGYKTI